jgi:hypothetical protein
MPPDDGDGPSTDPPERQERRRTPPPSSRTPPPRTRTGDRDAVEHRSVRPARPKGSMFGRVLGRQGLDDALEERLEPYEYQSTRPLLRWLFVGLLAFTAAGVFTAFLNVEFRNQVDEWQSEGLTVTPIGPGAVAQGTLIADHELQNPEEALCNEAELETGSPVAQGCRSIDLVYAYAASEGIECRTLEGLSSLVSSTRTAAPGCERVAELSTRFEDLNNRSNIMDVVLVLLVLIVAFPFSSFVHRSSRNLRTLKSEGQKHSPDGTVIRFFIPILNLYKPLFMFIELFKASDPRVPDGDGNLWQKRGGVSPTAVVWAVAWAAVVIFNPITVANIFYGDAEDLADYSTVTGGLIIADILIVVLGVTAILMSNTLSRWQDTRAAKFGTATVTPVRPRDPLEKALDDSARRRERSATGSRDRGSKRNQK